MKKALAVYRKEQRQILRDRRTLLILVFIPALFLLLYGYALNFDIRHIALAVDDRDSSPQSRSVVSAFVNSGYFDLIATTHSPAEIERLVNLNRARAVLIIPEGFGRDLSSGLHAPVQVIIDGDNANTATTVLGYATSLLRTVGAELSPSAIVRPAPRAPLTVEPRIWYNPELRSTLFLVPGLIAYIGMITAVASTALSIVREKEFGTMEQVRMAPIGTFSFVLGKTLPYFLISLTSAALIILASMVLFGLPMRGNWLALLLATSLFLIGALGTGLLISTVADSQQVAFQMALLISLLPTIMLSGFIFPISGMPGFLQAVTYAVPAKYFLIALRGVVLKGWNLIDVWPALAALAVYGLVVLSLSAQLWGLRNRSWIELSSVSLEMGLPMRGQPTKR
jgi:ABC-2 type transport system permease protein